MAQALGEIPEAWAASIDDFRDHLIVSGRMAATLDIRLYQMARFARAYPADRRRLNRRTSSDISRAATGLRALARSSGRLSSRTSGGR